MRPYIAAALLLVILGGLAWGQAQTDISQKTGGECSPAVVSQGKVTITCIGLDPRQQELLRKMPGLIDQLLKRSQSDRDELLAKLEEILKIQREAEATKLPSLAATNCLNGICISGGTVTNPTVTNTTGLAPPDIQLTPIVLNHPDGELYRTEVRMTIRSDVPIPSLGLRLDGQIVSMQAVPQRAGMEMEGHSGVREGYVFCTLLNAYGEYILTVLSRTPLEHFHLIYDPQGLGSRR